MWSSSRRSIDVRYTGHVSTRAGAVPRLAYCSAKKKTAGDGAYSVVAPWLWNELPADIRSCRAIEAFKKQLKTHLFTSIFNVL
jgi:hypothetical protein